MPDPTLDLLTAVSTSHLRLDEAAVYAEGRRRARRRRLALNGAASVLAVAVAGGGWYVASSAPWSASGPRVVTAADAAPANGASDGAASGIGAGGGSRPDSGTTETTSASPTLRTTYTSRGKADGTLRVQRRDADGTWRTIAEAAVAQTMSHPLVMRSRGAEVTAVAFPADATGVAVHAAVRPGASASGEYLPEAKGSGVRVLVQVTDDGSAAGGPVVVWADAHGRIRDLAGAPVPSAVDPERSETWFVLADGSYWGALQDPWADHRSPQSTSPNMRLNLMSTAVDGAGHLPFSTNSWDGESHALFAALVPIVAREVRVEVGPGIQLLSPVRTLPIPGSDRAVVLATVSLSKGSGREVTSVSWRVGGARVTGAIK